MAHHRFLAAQRYLLVYNSIYSRNFVSHVSYIGKRNFSASPVVWSFSDRVKDAIKAFTPRELLEEPKTHHGLEDENQANRSAVYRGRYNRKYVVSDGGVTGPHTKLPNHLVHLISSIPNPSDRLLALIESDEVPVDVLMVLYRPVLGSLDELCVLQFALRLYAGSRYKECFSVIMENMSLSDGLLLITDKLIPLIYTEKIDQADFAAMTFIKAFIQARQLNAASQLSQELKGSSTENGFFEHINLDTSLEEAQLQLNLLAASDTHRILQLLHDSSLCPAKSIIQEYFIEEDNKLHITTLVAILKALLIQGNTQLCEECLRSVISIRGLLQSMVRDISNYQESSPDQQHIFNSFHGMVCTILQTLTKADKVTFRKSDILSIPALGVTKASFTTLWKSYLRYLKNNHMAETPLRHTTKTLEAFLRQSIDLKQSITCTSIIKQARKKIIDPILVARAVNLLMWSSKKKDDVDHVGFSDIDSVNPELLERVARHTHPDVFNEAVLLAVKKINSQLGLTKVRVSVRSDNNNEQEIGSSPSQFPAVPLWTLLGALQHQPHLPQDLERELGISIASRSMLEHLRYFSLRSVSGEGIEYSIGARIDLMSWSASNGAMSEDIIDHEMNVKLLLYGLILIGKKNGGMELSPPPDSFDDALIEMFARLETSSISPDVVNRTIKYLIKRHQFQEALLLAELIPKHKLCTFPNVAISAGTKTYENMVPLKLYYLLLIDASKQAPSICIKVLDWLRTQQQIPIPSWVLRKMAVGFSESKLLTAGQSSRRVVWMFRKLRARGESLGLESTVAYVESIISRSEKHNKGSRQRLRWAIGLAKQEGVDDETMRKWLVDLNEMRVQQKGYWR